MTVRFEFGKDEVKRWYDERIKVAAALINGSPSSSVVIEGHTDSIGKSAPNQSLSVRRAQALKDKLVKLGVDPNRITVKGYGFSRPVAKNDTPEGRQKNRRAVAVILVRLPQQPTDRTLENRSSAPERP